MVHDLSRTLNVPKRINKETPGNDSHILSFSISVFNNFSRVSVCNFHHFLYSVKYLSLLCDLNGRHDSEWVIVSMRGLDRIRKFGFFRTSDMVQHDCVSNKHEHKCIAFKTVQYNSLLWITKLIVEAYILQ